MCESVHVCVCVHMRVSAYVCMFAKVDIYYGMYGSQEATLGIGLHLPLYLTRALLLLGELAHKPLSGDFPASASHCIITGHQV